MGTTGHKPLVEDTDHGRSTHPNTAFIRTTSLVLMVSMLATTFLATPNPALADMIIRRSLRGG